MKKLATLTFVLALCMLVFCSCGSEPTVNQEAMDSLLGGWDCQDTILEEQGAEDAAYVGFYQYRVFNDGTFTLVDVEAGNPGIAGFLYPDGEGNMQVKCDEGDFDPPYHWREMGMKTDTTLQYSIQDVDGVQQLHLSYTAKDGTVATLVFDRME